MKKINLLFCIFALYGCGAHEHYIGEHYLGVQYVNNPLGEEKKPDTDPLIRTDAFDCATFVETALANGDKDKLTKIRYKDGEIDFLNRNHFIETDWIKNNSDIVENVSNKYGKTSIRTVTIDKKSWFKKIYDMKTEFKPETVDLEYIPIDDALNVKTKEPMVVLFVASNPMFLKEIGTDLAITHMGFLLPDNILRHASLKFGKVVDENFNEYIEYRKLNKHNIGIALLKIK